MKPNNLILFASGAFTLFSNAYAQEKNQETDKKAMNILYIMSDDHSYQTISAYDKRYINTPNLDRLADEGVIFSNSFVANSISGPSRACLITGKHSHKNGFMDNSTSFDGSQQTFPKLLQQAGYETAIVGKWHLHSNPTGFDYWNILPGQGEYYNPIFINNGAKETKEGYVTNITTDIALDWLDNERDKNKPFMMLLHHKAPHRTWMPDTVDLGLFDDIEFPLPNNFFDDYDGRKAAKEQKISIIEDMDLVYDLKMADPENEIHTKSKGLESVGRDVYNRVGGPGRMNEVQKTAWDDYYLPIIKDFKEQNPQDKELANWKFQRYMKDYLSVINSVDRNVGRVLDYLEENGLIDNTIIVYTSDQGFYMGEHGWFDKRFMYQESYRTPLLIRYPNGEHREIDQLVQNIDHAATFLELAGVPIPDDIQDESYLPLLEGENPENWRESLYYHFYEFPDEHAVKKHYGVSTKKYKLIHFYDDINEWEFYDLENDPNEMNNLINVADYILEVETVKNELVRLQELYDDPIEKKLNQEKL